MPAGAQRENSGKKRKAIEAEDSDEEGEPSAKKSKFAKGGKGKFDKGDRKGDKRGDRREDKRGDKREGKGRRDDKVEKKTGKDEKDGEKRGLEKLGSHLGSLIGRKRKMRKGGK